MELITQPRKKKSNNPLPQKPDPSDVQATHETRVTIMDRPLMLAIFVLVFIGVASVFSASAHEAQLETGNSFAIVSKQVVFALIGFTVMFIVSRVSFQFWRRTAKPLAIVSIILLFLTLVMGVTANGSERWIPLPFGLQFQPSDVAKLSAIILMAQVASQRKIISLTLWANLGLIGTMVFFIYQQPNLSVSIIIGFLTVFMLFLGGFPLTYLFVGGAVISYNVVQKIMATEYQWRRITGWLDPWADPQDKGYNLIHSYFAIGSGGLFGLGFGHSIEKLSYLPFPYTDFIFSVICEEWGLFGGLIIIALFGFIAWRGFSISMNCPSTFGQMLAFGITTTLILQAIINISVTIGMMPVTGVTLPFVSYGGTSLVISLLMIGILLNISRYKVSTVSTRLEKAPQS